MNLKLDDYTKSIHRSASCNILEETLYKQSHIPDAWKFAKNKDLAIC